MKRAQVPLVGLICVAILAGCGHMAAAGPRLSSPIPSTSPALSMAPSQLLNCLEPGHDYNAPASPPVPQRLAVGRLCGQDQLEPVPTNVTPKVSGAAAYARCDRCDKSINITEELAYYSAAMPATMPAGCLPVPNVPMPAVCNLPGTPVYDHRLVWFFVGTGVCFSDGPGPFRTFPGCVSFVPMDASNGSIDFSTSG